MRRYLGSKKKILNEIEALINAKDIKTKVFVDVFAGSGVVSSYFSKKYNILANDYMYYSFISASALLNTHNIDTDKINEIVFEMNNLELATATNGDFIHNNFSPGGREGRKYFSENNALIIDRARQYVEELYIDNKITELEYLYLLHVILDSVQMVSNITGTYSAFLKKWDSRALKKVIFQNTEIIETQKDSKVFNLDVFDFLNKVPEDSIIYLDPPYTTLDYAGAYHVLETIARYDAPIIYGISGRRKNNKKSDFHKKTTVKKAFIKMINHLPKKSDIIISYSSHGLLSYEDIFKIIKNAFPLSDISLKEIDYSSYSNINKHNVKKGNLKECLIHFRTHQPIKAPFNYQGSKENIAYEIRKIIPANTNKIIEPFVGGFNFGLNTHVKNFIINDNNSEVIELLKFLYKSDKFEVIKKIEKLIKQFNLKKNDKSSFNKLRKQYNKTKEPLLLILLLLYTYNYQLRFNNSREFNNPVGLGKYTNLKKNQILDFVRVIQTKKIEFKNENFQQMEFSNLNSIYYLDPPYLITTASYNDGKRGGTGWNTKLEEDLLTKLSNLDSKGGRFILSNVIKHNEKRNNILASWISENNFSIKKILYKNREEVVIWNFKNE